MKMRKEMEMNMTRDENNKQDKRQDKSQITKDQMKYQITNDKRDECEKEGKCATHIFLLVRSDSISDGKEM